jgi:Phosphoesterase family
MLCIDPPHRHPCNPVIYQFGIPGSPGGGKSGAGGGGGAGATAPTRTGGASGGGGGASGGGGGASGGGGRAPSPSGVHAREPFVRQLFRHPLWRQRFRRHATQSAAGIPTARLGTVTDWRRSHRLHQPKQYTLPFRLDTQRGPSISGQCINDPDHSWIGMRAAWNLGANNNWLSNSIRCAPRDGTSASAGTGPISPTSSLLRVETPPRRQLSRG